MTCSTTPSPPGEPPASTPRSSALSAARPRARRQCLSDSPQREWWFEKGRQVSGGCRSRHGRAPGRDCDRLHVGRVLRRRDGTGSRIHVPSLRRSVCPEAPLAWSRGWPGESPTPPAPSHPATPTARPPPEPHRSPPVIHKLIRSLKIRSWSGNGHRKSPELMVRTVNLSQKSLPADARNGRQPVQTLVHPFQWRFLELQSQVH